MAIGSPVLLVLAHGVAAVGPLLSFLEGKVLTSMSGSARLEEGLARSSRE